ncbi:DUF962 domain-containing protein [Leptospira gomenensis]|uniref:DUF962 domain-containing protein n=1 Tax=Leptospira gomenensis TaxID=2484974 RepID=A0A5F1YAZ5_9LEPT|nr:Mpo1-like protein [Leptospira gomenensis]TGK33282.1 DUF962 domain-containing protein [Leptospira gomenensis]TGK45125.1 DUF962 domain-containing protein [Leptospira gomenensis]TGK50910.1 DUF962 domain-containing protein [Leptospira gomenensis]TGK56533.1 DUF962 domain-containing protein [Leptospira gomenensis]
MKTIEQWLSEYAESHQNKVNKRIHWIAVPTIMFTLLGMLWSIPSGFLQTILPESLGQARLFLNWATIFVLITGIFYLRLSIPMFIGMMSMVALMLGGIYYIALSGISTLISVSVSVFVVAWIFQFIGHKIEGKKPSFFKDLQFLLIGPAWCLSYLYKKIGISY